MRNAMTALLAIVPLTLSVTGEAKAAAIPLQTATATFSQTSFSGNPVGNAIDGSLATNNAWAIYESTTQNVPNSTNPQTAVFETVSDVVLTDGPFLTFTLTHNFSAASPHTLGRFRISATTDDRSLFADGLATGGDVTANWAVLPTLSATATNGATLTVQGDGSILAGGPNPATSLYTITTPNPSNGLTGFRLEVLADASFSDSGPGRANNGNFALTEFQVSALPEPTTLTLLGLGVMGLLRSGRSKRM